MRAVPGTINFENSPGGYQDIMDEARDMSEQSAASQDIPPKNPFEKVSDDGSPAVAAPIVPEEPSFIPHVRDKVANNVDGGNEKVLLEYADALRAVAKEAISQVAAMRQSRDEWKSRYGLMDNARIEAEAQAAALRKKYVDTGSDASSGKEGT